MDLKDCCISLCFVSISSKLQFGHQQFLSARLCRHASSVGPRLGRPTCMYAHPLGYIAYIGYVAYMHVWQPPCPSFACSPICLLCLHCLHWPTCMYANPLAPPPICIAPPFAVACFRRKKSARGRLINLVLICISLSSCRVQALGALPRLLHRPICLHPNLISYILRRSA